MFNGNLEFLVRLGYTQFEFHSIFLLRCNLMKPKRMNLIFFILIYNFIKSFVQWLPHSREYRCDRPHFKKNTLSLQILCIVHFHCALGFWLIFFAKMSKSWTCGYILSLWSVTSLVYYYFSCFDFVSVLEK